MTRETYDFSDYPDASYVTITVEDTSAEYNTLEDWNLGLTLVTIGDPLARKFEVVVPGRDGTLDLSDALGGIYYENRQIEIRFTCLNYDTERFHLLSSTIRNAIDGKMCRFVFSDDLAFFWRGRPQVAAQWPNIEHTDIVITLNAEPYKYNVTSSYDPWEWDSFNFITGTVTQTSDVILNDSTETLTLPIDPARGKPTLWLNTGSARARLSGEQTWHTLKAGSNVFPEIRMSATAERTLVLNGTGSVGVEYRVGSL